MGRTRRMTSKIHLWSLPRARNTCELLLYLLYRHVGVDADRRGKELQSHRELFDESLAAASANICRAQALLLRSLRWIVHTRESGARTLRVPCDSPEVYSGPILRPLLRWTRYYVFIGVFDSGTEITTVGNAC